MGNPHRPIEEAIALEEVFARIKTGFPTSAAVVPAPPRGRPPQKKGELCYNARLTEAHVCAIRTSTETGKALAVRYGVTQMTICDIRKRRSWRHID